MEITHSEREIRFAVKTPYAVAWTDEAPGRELLGDLAVAGTERWPFFVCGETLLALDEGRQVVFLPAMLADGILFVWCDHLAQREIMSKPLWQKFLSKMAIEAGYKDATEFITERAGVLREQAGYQASAKLLQTALSLSARDSVLRARVLVEQFFAWRGVLDGKRWQALSDIVGKVDLRHVNQEQTETVVMIGICALYFLGAKKWTINNYLNKFVYMMVYDMGYRKLVKALLDANLLEEEIFLAVYDHVLRYR